VRRRRIDKTCARSKYNAVLIAQSPHIVIF
jgi:hypothetical protein